MPVSTQIIRDGKPRPIRWGWWHIEVLADAMNDEMENHGHEKIELFMGFPNAGSFTFEQRHRYFDPTDWELFYIEPGDEYRAWR
jgi:hypothetical protein